MRYLILAAFSSLLIFCYSSSVEASSNGMLISTFRPYQDQLEQLQELAALAYQLPQLRW